ncbi:MAG TPA: hypothetical protein VM753_18420 [Anaeromyxobacter sp.]|jgi:hypothetical protein|nr:hypothetical protein [Anaeromyxobacter sp.]
MRAPRTPLRAARLAVLTAILALPAMARADLRLLDEPLRPPAASAPDLSLRGVLVAQEGEAKPAADGEPKPAEAAGGDPKAAPAAGGDAGGMDFDLLGEAKPPPDAADAGALRLRRQMLTAHQAIGFGLLATQLATTVAGQLNYSDKFGSSPTGRYQMTHAALAYTNLALFAVNGAIALLAPSPVKRSWEMDRVMVHRIAMFTAAAGMLAQGVLGVYTSQREGYLNQEQFATAHLAIGYGTLAAMAVGVGALVF